MARKTLREFIDEFKAWIDREPKEVSFWPDMYLRDKKLFEYDLISGRLAEIDRKHQTEFCQYLKYLKGQFYEMDQYMWEKPLGLGAALIATQYLNELGKMESDFRQHKDIYKSENLGYITRILFENMSYCMDMLSLNHFIATLPKNIEDFYRDYVR